MADTESAVAQSAVADLQTQHDQLERKLVRMGKLADQLEHHEGFDELDRLTQVMKNDLVEHFAAEEKVARAMWGDGDEELADLLQQHKDLSEHYRTLLGMMQDVRDDMPVDRELFMKTVRGVLTQMKVHLDAEQRTLLREGKDG